jgi:hypothetical protein
VWAVFGWRFLRGRISAPCYRYYDADDWETLTKAIADGKVAVAEGIELTVDELAEVSGGGWSPKDGLPKCASCGSYAIHIFPLPGTGCASCVCHDCGHQWTKTVLDPILPTG